MQSKQPLRNLFEIVQPTGTDIPVYVGCNNLLLVYTKFGCATERCTRGEKPNLFTSSLVLRYTRTFPLDVRYVMCNKHTAKIEMAYTIVYVRTSISNTYAE